MTIELSAQELAAAKDPPRRPHAPSRRDALAVVVQEAPLRIERWPPAVRLGVLIAASVAAWGALAGIGYLIREVAIRD